MAAPDSHQDRLRSRRGRYRGISLGTTLICVGIILLLNTLDRLGWGVWFWLLRLWPVLLISMGIRLIFVNTRLHPLSLIGPALVVGATFWSVQDYQERGGRWRQEMAGGETLELECPAPPIGRPAKLSLKLAAGMVDLVSETAETRLAASAPAAGVPAAGGLRATLRYQGRKPRALCGDAGSLHLGSRWSGGGIHFVWPFEDHKVRWEGRLASASPLDLDVDLAAASADLDLRSLVLDRADMDLAASTVLLHLGAPHGRVPIRIDGAVTQLEVLVPEGTCVTVSRRRVLNILDVEDAAPPRRARWVSSQACSPPGASAEAMSAIPRYEITYELPISTVSVGTEAG